MDHWDLVNQGEPSARQVCGNKKWLSSRRKSDVVKSSRNKNLKYHQKFRQKLEESSSVIRYMLMVGLKNLFA